MCSGLDNSGKYMSQKSKTFPCTGVKFYFQPQNSLSNIDLIHLEIIFYLEYWISRTIFIIAMIPFIHF